MSWGLTELPDGPRISLFGLLLAGRDGLSRSRESISASRWNNMGTTDKAPDGQWSTYAGPSRTHGWSSPHEDPLSWTFPRPHGSQKTITGTGLPGSKRIIGISSMATPPSRNSWAGTPAEKSVRFLRDSLPSAKAGTPSPVVKTSNVSSTASVSSPERRPCPSYNRAVQQLQKRTSSPRLPGRGFGQGSRQEPGSERERFSRFSGLPGPVPGLYASEGGIPSLRAAPGSSRGGSGTGRGVCHIRGGASSAPANYAGTSNHRPGSIQAVPPIVRSGSPNWRGIGFRRFALTLLIPRKKLPYV